MAALCWSPAAVALIFAAYAAWSLRYEVSSTVAAHSACLPALGLAGEILADPGQPHATGVLAGWAGGVPGVAGIRGLRGILPSSAGQQVP